MRIQKCNIDSENIIIHLRWRRDVDFNNNFLFATIIINYYIILFNI